MQSVLLLCQTGSQMLPLIGITIRLANNWCFVMHQGRQCTRHPSTKTLVATDLIGVCRQQDATQCQWAQHQRSPDESSIDPTMETFKLKNCSELWSHSDVQCPQCLRSKDSTERTNKLEACGSGGQTNAPSLLARRVLSSHHRAHEP